MGPKPKECVVKQNLLVCIPVDMFPEYIERSCKENGDQPEDYTKIACPDCQRLMWLGPRVKVLWESGMKATCGVCAILKYKITQKEAANMTVMTKVLKDVQG